MTNREHNLLTWVQDAALRQAQRAEELRGTNNPQSIALYEQALTRRNVLLAVERAIGGDLVDLKLYAEADRHTAGIGRRRTSRRVEQ